MSGKYSWCSYRIDTRAEHLNIMNHSTAAITPTQIVSNLVQIYWNNPLDVSYCSSEVLFDFVYPQQKFVRCSVRAEVRHLRKVLCHRLNVEKHQVSQKWSLSL